MVTNGVHVIELRSFCDISWVAILITHGAACYTRKARFSLSVPLAGPLIASGNRALLIVDPFNAGLEGPLLRLGLAVLVPDEVDPFSCSQVVVDCFEGVESRHHGDGQAPGESPVWFSALP